MTARSVKRVLSEEPESTVLDVSRSIEFSATLALVRRAQAGEQEALEQLFTRYYAPVRAFVSGRLGHALRLEAESGDIMQETFLVAIERFDRFELRDDASMINWLSAIAENRIRGLAQWANADKRDRRRQRSLCMLRDSVASGRLRQEPAAEITLPGEACERLEMQARLEAALDALSSEHREVIMHRTYAKATWEQVARLLGKKSEGAARHLHAQAMLALGAQMGD